MSDRQAAAMDVVRGGGVASRWAKPYASKRQDVALGIVGGFGGGEQTVGSGLRLIVGAGDRSSAKTRHAGVKAEARDLAR